MKTINTDIERLFRAHYQEMYHLARCILMDDAESKDVVSEVFEQLLERPVVLVPKSETGYLMQAVRNRCRNVIAHKSMKERVKRLLTDDETSLSMMADDGIISRLAELEEADCDAAVRRGADLSGGCQHIGHQQGHRLQPSFCGSSTTQTTTKRQRQ